MQGSDCNFCFFNNIVFLCRLRCIDVVPDFLSRHKIRSVHKDVCQAQVRQKQRCQLSAVSVWKAGKPPVYHNCFTVEQCEKSAKRRDVEMRLAASTRLRRSAALFRTTGSQRRWWQTGVKKKNSLSHRIVFTIKRTITARPTHPHITPITIAVTSPAQGKAQRGSADRGKPPRVQRCDYLQRQRDFLFVFFVRQSVVNRTQSYQRKAPSLILQQNKK